MNEDNKVWIAVWTLTCIAFCTLVITIGITTYKINEKAFSNGYESSSLPGIQSARWVKVK